MKDILIITSIFFLVSFILTYLYQLRVNNKISKRAHKALLAIGIVIIYSLSHASVELPKQLARQDELELVIQQ